MLVEDTLTEREATREGEAKSEGDKATMTSSKDGEETAVNVPGYQPTPEDLCLLEVYGDLVHANLGMLLDGGVRDDLAWQAWWCDLAVMPSRRYDAPSGKVGPQFVGTVGGGDEGGALQTVELRAVHCLPDSDPATSPSCHCIPGDQPPD